MTQNQTSGLIGTLRDVPMWYKDNQLGGSFMTHVEDFLWAECNKFQETVLDQLCKKIQVRSLF